eukprot:GFYU01070366.1.p2 GENE.GFYU01070366.1~~GFYU01070366.1.p2  ORF type:complete len:100 (-),score=8.56 GFYU01070366.1:55-354(-)
MTEWPRMGADGSRTQERGMGGATAMPMLALMAASGIITSEGFTHSQASVASRRWYRATSSGVNANGSTDPITIACSSLVSSTTRLSTAPPPSGDEGVTE